MNAKYIFKIIVKDKGLVLFYQISGSLPLKIVIS